MLYEGNYNLYFLGCGMNNLSKIIPSDNADMSNEKGISPRLKLMVFSLK